MYGILLYSKWRVLLSRQILPQHFDLVKSSGEKQQPLQSQELAEGLRRKIQPVLSQGAWRWRRGWTPYCCRPAGGL